MADYNQAKNERLRGRKYKYKENYITEVNTVHGVSEYEPKQETFELFEKENKFNESKQTDDTVQNENANLIETNRRERNTYLVDPMENRYNRSKAKKEGHPRKRYSEKCPLDLKTVHKYIPEKRYR